MFDVKDLDGPGRTKFYAITTGVISRSLQHELPGEVLKLVTERSAGSAAMGINCALKAFIGSVLVACHPLGGLQACKPHITELPPTIRKKIEEGAWGFTQPRASRYGLLAGLPNWLMEKQMVTNIPKEHQ